MDFIAQIAGFLAILSGFAGSWQKSRNGMLFFLCGDCLFYLIQYLLLGAATGAISNVIGLFRTTAFTRKDTNNFFKTNAILYIVLVLNIIMGIITYDGIMSLFPVVASCAYAVILWNNNPKFIRIGSLFISLMWAVYNVSVGAYIGALGELLLFGNTLLAVITLNRKSQKEECLSN